MKSAADLRVELALAIQRRDATAPVDHGDPALARVGPALHRRLTAANDRALARYVEADAKVDALRSRLILAEAREAEAFRTRLTAEQIKGARAVRTTTGWHKVVRVNTKTVTVETGYSWTDRYDHNQILEVA